LNFVALGGALASATTATGQEEARPVPHLPSGIEVRLQEVVIDAPAGMGEVARFRFVAPAIGQGIGFAEVAQDFAVLCRDHALPALSRIGAQPDRVVVSYAAAPVEFGAAAPDIVQFFEVFRLEDGACIWEGF
jgi:hypothetical protein